MKCYWIVLSVLIAANAEAIDLKYDPEFSEMVCGPDGCQIQDKDPCTEPKYRRWWQIQCYIHDNDADPACHRCSHIKSGIFTGSGDGTMGARQEQKKLQNAYHWKKWAIKKSGDNWRKSLPKKMVDRLEAEY